MKAHRVLLDGEIVALDSGGVRRSGFAASHRPDRYVLVASASRVSEVLPLEWRQVDLKAERSGSMRVNEGDAGRVFPFSVLPELRDVIDTQLKVRQLQCRNLPPQWRAMAAPARKAWDEGVRGGRMADADYDWTDGRSQSGARWCAGKNGDDADGAQDAQRLRSYDIVSRQIPSGRQPTRERGDVQRATNARARARVSSRARR